jgi:hypothetical protein
MAVTKKLTVSTEGNEGKKAESPRHASENGGDGVLLIAEAERRGEKPPHGSENRGQEVNFTLREQR